MSFGSGVSWAGLLAGGGGEGGGGGVSPRATGWASYGDNEYTDENPWVVPANIQMQLPNNSLGERIQTQLPEDINTFYNPATGRITGSNGSDLLMSIRLKVRPTTADASHVKLLLDIGTSGSPIVIESGESALPWGLGTVNELTIIYSPYCGPLFAQNGALLWFEADGPVEVFDIGYVIKRTHRGVF